MFKEFHTRTHSLPARQIENIIYSSELNQLFLKQKKTSPICEKIFLEFIGNLNLLRKKFEFIYVFLLIKCNYEILLHITIQKIQFFYTIKIYIFNGLFELIFPNLKFIMFFQQLVGQFK